MEMSIKLIMKLIAEGQWKTVILYLLGKEGFTKEDSELCEWLKLNSQSIPGSMVKSLAEIKRVKFSSSLCRQIATFISKQTTYDPAKKEVWFTPRETYVFTTVNSKGLTVLTYAALKYIGALPEQLYIAVNNQDRAFLVYRDETNNQEFMIDVANKKFLVPYTTIEEKYRFNESDYLAIE